MNKKWMTGGLLGGLLILLLFVGSAVAVVYLVREALVAVAEVEEDEEEKEARRYAKAVAESERKADALDLDEIYTYVYLFTSEHYPLYHDRDFAGVEERLAAAKAKATTPFERHRYGVTLDDLATLRSDDTPESMMAAADAWVAASPDTYLPLLIRGKLNLACAWHYRGDGYSNEVTPSGWKKFESFNESAWDDLQAAQALNQDDAEIPAALLEAAAGTGHNLSTLRRYYDETVALNPHHVAVRYAMLNYLRPVWFGSWSAMDDFYAENQEAIAEFAHLFEFYRNTSSLMEERGPAYEGVWDSDASMQQAADAFKKQVALTPDEPTVLASAAYFAARAGDMASAADFFERIGNQFPVVDEFTGLYDYHWWRMYALVERTDDADVVGTPREKELLDSVLALEPTHPGANGMYLGLLVRNKNDDQTIQFWESLGDAFLKTGELGSPPDYTRLEAMAKAARSDDHGVKGTERERTLLDEALALAPDNAFVRLVFAEHFISSDNFDEARPHLERARELDPGYLPALHIMGWLNYHQKRWDEGIATAKEFIASGPSVYVSQHREDAIDIIELCEKKKAQSEEG